MNVYLALVLTILEMGAEDGHLARSFLITLVKWDWDRLNYMLSLYNLNGDCVSIVIGNDKKKKGKWINET